MKKTNRKNKTNLVVNWPTGWFTVDSLLSQNSEFEKITLRVRVKKALEDKNIGMIGTLKGAKGRPKLVFATLPVSQETLIDAKTAGTILDNDTTNVMPVVDVKSSSETTDVVSEFTEGTSVEIEESVDNQVHA